VNVGVIAFNSILAKLHQHLMCAASCNRGYSCGHDKAATRPPPAALVPAANSNIGVKFNENVVRVASLKIRMNCCFLHYSCAEKALYSVFKSGLIP
jgi:hypothetical protein